MAITTADPYGLDYSLLSGPNQNTARQIQTAFTNSMNARNRAMQRYGIDSQLKYSPAMGASLLEDTALAQAQSAADAINKNQQLQTMIDASKATPHGVAANLSAYLPYLGAGTQLASLLFGTGTNSVMRQGLIPSAYNAIKGVFTDPNTGFNWHVDQNGNIVGATDQSGQPLENMSGWMDYWPGTTGAGTATSAAIPSGFGDTGWSSTSDLGSAATTAPYDFGTAASDAGSAFNFFGG